MNLTHLRYAVEVAKTGSITQAAENLYMGQPNLSKAIKDLEASVGMALFKRTPKGMVPTARGAEFLAHAREILFQIEEMELLYQKNNPNQIRFSISVPRASYITYAFTNFINKLDQTKELELNFKETNSMEAIHKIVEGEFQLGIIRYQLDHEAYYLNLLAEKDLPFLPIWEFDYLVLLSRRHPLAEKEILDWQDLRPYLEVTHGDNLVPSSVGGTAGKRTESSEPNRRIFVYERGSQFCLLSRVPATYMLVSPLPEEVLQRYGLIQRRCRDRMPRYKDVVIYPKGYRFNSLEQLFIAELMNVKEELEEIEYR